MVASHPTSSCLGLGDRSLDLCALPVRLLSVLMHVAKQAFRELPCPPGAQTRRLAGEAVKGCSAQKQIWLHLIVGWRRVMQPHRLQQARICWPSFVQANLLDAASSAHVMSFLVGPGVSRDSFRCTCPAGTISCPWPGALQLWATSPCWASSWQPKCPSLRPSLRSAGESPVHRGLLFQVNAKVPTVMHCKSIGLHEYVIMRANLISTL